ncbi:coiled-coil domain-containing protein 186-like isoform X2 [Ceratina calcarata]|uniref:Coiled-coil domain-containing protein 186-like isoform X2 n=1 Tax=Ceratina calcarata TaxID=156304 RepID=A0AAJ7J767_9HYME|nr:coiled-coil domain-containing protein 186-like isoform X2 [Ceratina calcarata]
MDEDNSESTPSQEREQCTNNVQTSFDANVNVSHAEVTDVSSRCELRVLNVKSGNRMHDVPEELARDHDDINQVEGPDSVLFLLSVKNDNERKCKEFMDKNSIPASMKGSRSFSNFSELEMTTTIEDVLSGKGDRPLEESSSYDDVRLQPLDSSELSYASSDIISDYDMERTMPQPRKLEMESKNVEVCNDDEKEIVFSTKFYANKKEMECLEKTDVDDDDGRRVNDYEIEKCSMESTENVGPMRTALKDVIENDEKLLFDSEGSKVRSDETGGSGQSRSVAISRPNLIDDSRLVKISLPTNPIGMMRSNAPFLNKSRNFLNFITEKSTNIMEKALLPQHLTLKYYNSVIKTVDDDDRNRVDGRKKREYNGESSDMNAKPVLLDGRTESPTRTPTNAETVCATVPRNEGDERETVTGTVVNSNEAACTNIEKDRVSDENKENDSNESGDLPGFAFDRPTSDIPDGTNRSYDEDREQETNEDHGSRDVDSVQFDFNGQIIADRSTTEHRGSPRQERNGSVVDDSEHQWKHESLQHPAYLSLLRNYADLKTEYLKLRERIESSGEGRIRMIDKKTDDGNDVEAAFVARIAKLEKTIDELTFDLRSSLEAQEMLKKEYHAANKERENMVMRYAVSEEQLIDTRRAKENAERKLKEMMSQQEGLRCKLREMQAERGRMCNVLTGKHRELTDLQKEVEKLREDVKMRDVKLHWTQNKLRTEMDAQKETRQRLERATARIDEMKEECEQVRRETQETMRRFQQSEENKAVTLDQQLKEQQARLILERHVTEDKEMLRVQLQKEVDTLKHRQQLLVEENNTLSLKIQDAEKSRAYYESSLSDLKIVAERRQKEIVELLGKVSELETLRVQLRSKDQCLASTEAEVQRLQASNEELQADMSACREKEAEMLNFTQKLTEKNVRLQSEFTAMEARGKRLEREHGPLHERINQLVVKVNGLEERVAEERKRRTEECEVLARHLAERTEAAEQLTRQLEDCQGENAVLKRKQRISMKEMTRELQQCRKRLETFETTSSSYNNSSLGVASRTGSNASLNTGDTLNGASLSDNSIDGDHGGGSSNRPPTEPTKQALIDRIIKLQESNARKAEKLDFFEEHTRILVEELQKKKRIIQNYILHEDIGAMGGNDRDKYKAELARHGGIMASVYNQRVSDENMTLELSLEINQKLQAVLEDALFKNITLKDNIDTLGEEIARLTMQNQQRRQSKN